MGILNRFKIGPKIIGGYVVAGLAMGILAFMLLNSLSGLSEKFDFLVHHDTPVLTNAQKLTGLMVDMEKVSSECGSPAHGTNTVETLRRCNHPSRGPRLVAPR